MTNREIDALVAEKVFGYSITWMFGKDQPAVREDDSWRCVVPKYSTNISDAWRVVEKLNKEQLVKVTQGRRFAQCRVGLYGESKQTIVAATGSTAPMAICKAALKSVGVEL